MGGGGAIRAASKVAGNGVVQARIVNRNSRLPLPTQHSGGNVSSPVSAFTSSSSQGVKADPPTQKPALELDDREFAEQLELETAEKSPRQVFGGAPSLQEAKTATAELKDTLNKIYMLSSYHAGAAPSGLSLLAKRLETKSCIIFEPHVAPPKHAIAAISLLNESSQAQSIVASIASDPNVWDAVLKNKALLEFLKPLQNTDLASPKFTELSEDESEYSSFKSKPADILESSKVVIVDIKNAVIDMINNFSSHLQSIFGLSTMENTIGAEENSKSSFNDKAIGASFLGLAVMVILVVVLKRG